VLEKISQATERRCLSLKERLGRLSRQQDHDYVWSIAGAAEVNAKIAAMIEAATRHVWVKGSEDRLDPHRDALARAADRGVEILVILFGKDAGRFRFGGSCRTYLHEGNGIPVGIAPHLVTLTRDFEEALVADLRGSANGSYTRARPIVNMADTLLRHEVYFAEIFERFGDEIQEAFGTALIDLRRKYLPGEQAAELLRFLEAGAGSGPAPPPDADPYNGASFDAHRGGNGR
jgi:hypothetical protein